MSKAETFWRGDVVLVEVPFADTAAVKLRPAVVVQNNVGNRVSGNLIVAAVTSQVPARLLPTQYEIPAGSALARAAGLPLRSAVDCSVIYTVSKVLVQRKLGALPPEVMAEVDRCLKISLALA